MLVNLLKTCIESIAFEWCTVISVIEYLSINIYYMVFNFTHEYAVQQLFV
jgi:hypothetical protein